jgi:hypothetical protein
MIVCEVLKIDTNEIWAFDYEVFIGSDIWNQLQASTNPTELGCWFVRILE